MKKTAGVFAALLLSVSMLAGCGKTADTADDTGAVNDNVTAAETQENVKSASAKVTIEGTKFMVNGKELWINGVNTAWQNWNEFDGHMDEAAWEETFKELQAQNVNCTRIWVNCCGLNSVKLKTTGEFKEVNEGHWTDLDKLFALAEKYEIYVMPTLFSFDHCKEPNSGYDRWRTLITTNEYVDALAENYVAEFAKRYGDCEYIFGVDIMNEPDWVFENAECGKLPWENLSYFFGKCAAAIHENSDLLVTVGMGMAKYNSDKYQGNMVSDEMLKTLTGSDSAYLDFYSPHFYAWQLQTFGLPFDKSPTDYGYDGTKPVVIGETSNDDDDKVGMTCAEKYKSAYDNGWNGVMVWMEYRTDGTSGCDSLWYRNDLTAEATKGMYEYVPEKIYPLM